jgi:carboxyl-terminal processing protease
MIRLVSKARVIGLITSAALIFSVFVVLPGMGADEGKDKDGLYRPLGLFTEVLTLVKSNYVESVDTKPLFAGAYSGLTEAMDPFSEYVPPEKMAAFSAAQAAKEKKEAVDTGIVLARKFGYPVVVAAIAGSPAAAAGVQSDDVLEKIDGQPTRGMAIWEVEAKLAGKPGGRVSLTVVREGKPRHRTFDVVRASWAPKAPWAARVEGETVLTIPSFSPGTTEALKAILAPLDRTKPLILDLRSNAWGSFDEAARSAALFVAPGPLGELKGRKIESKAFSAGPGERVHESRLVLLMDSGTAGPAELFASALRDAAAKEAGIRVAALPKDATRMVATANDGSEVPVEDEPAPSSPMDNKSPVRLVGEPTVGMGFTSQIVKLASGGALRISVGKIHTVSGRVLSPKGIAPDDRVYPLPQDDGAGSKAPADMIMQRGLKILSEQRSKSAA